MSAIPVDFVRMQLEPMTVMTAIRMALNALVVIVVVSATAAAQTTETRPALKLPTAVFLAGAALDNISTQHFLHRGGIDEINPMLKFANNNPVVIGVAAAATDAITLWLAHKYAPKHPKLMRAALIGVGSVRMSFGFHNLGVDPVPDARCTRRQQSATVASLCDALPTNTRPVTIGAAVLP